MTQKPPRIITRFVIYGDTKPIVDAGEIEPLPYDITDSLGVEPTAVSHDDHILSWEYTLPEQNSWELPELLSDMMKKFDPEKVIRVLAEHKLEAEVAATVYITDSNPVMFFPPYLLSKLSDFGAGLDVDIIKTV
jgi:hypothetical protein